MPRMKVYDGFLPFALAKKREKIIKQRMSVKKKFLIRMQIQGNEN